MLLVAAQPQPYGRGHVPELGSDCVNEAMAARHMGRGIVSSMVGRRMTS